MTLSRTLKKYKIHPSKRLGQNFLVDKSAVKKIISAAELTEKDVVLEIGPGTGVLTKELAKRAKKVIAIEKDKRMVKLLKETLNNLKNVKIIHGDILSLETFLGSFSEKRLPDKFKALGNLPFYLTAPVIRKFLECNEPRPSFMVFVVQKEVAKRICSKPPKMNLLAVSVQFYAKPKILSYIHKTSFLPKPKVDSAIIKITPYVNKHKVNKLSAQLFFKVVRAGFSQPRKHLVNNLSKKLKSEKDKVREWLLKSKIQPEQRAETLTIKDWVSLAKTIINEKT